MLGNRFRLAFVVLLAAVYAVEASAQSTSSSLPAELGWVKFRISGGRLQIASPRYRESRTFEASNPLAGTSESLRLNISAESSSVHYRQHSPRQTLTIDFDAPHVVVIKRLPGEKNESLATVKFAQESDGKVHLTVEDAESETRKHSGDSFWHLMLLAHDDTNTHLLPLLESLRPGWPIAETANEIEGSLIRMAGRSVRPQRERWEQWVNELGSPSFEKRRRAERMLRESGPAVVAYLTTLPPDSMDAERKARIARLLGALSTSADDTPDRIAMWLIDDPLIWTTVLESEEVAHRQIAKDQLEELLHGDIDFDADADQDERVRQIQAIRAAISP